MRVPAGQDPVLTLLPPTVARCVFVTLRARTFHGAAAVDPARAGELKAVLRKPVFKEPGTFAIINQRSIFGRGIGGGRKIEFDISGPELEDILAVALRATGRITKLMLVPAAAAARNSHHGRRDAAAKMPPTSKAGFGMTASAKTSHATYWVISASSRWWKALSSITPRPPSPAR